MDIIKKVININPGYDVIITYHNNSFTRYYRLIDINQDMLIVESFNRDAFLIKVNNIIKLTNQQELLIASI